MVSIKTLNEWQKGMRQERIEKEKKQKNVYIWKKSFPKIENVQNHNKINVKRRTTNMDAFKLNRSCHNSIETQRCEDEKRAQKGMHGFPWEEEIEEISWENWG